MTKDNVLVAVIGLGFSGLPVAAAFSEKYRVVGYDPSMELISQLELEAGAGNGLREMGAKPENLTFTSDASRLAEAGFLIITMPAILTLNHQQDLTPLLEACETVGKQMKKGAVVVLESALYPGTTEEKCIPVLEKHSGFKAGEEFFVGYSPERIHSGEKKLAYTKIKKVVSGQSTEVCDFIAEMYGTIVKAGVFKAKSIRVAEAAKLIENIQQEVNVALMNDLALTFNHLGIDTYDALETAGTKKNFMKFTPDLIGGTSYYLNPDNHTTNFYPQIYLTGKSLNDGTGRFIARSLVKKLIQNHVQVQGSRITVLGLANKQDVGNLKNSKIIEVIRELQEYGADVQVSDVTLDPVQVEKACGIELIPEWELMPAAAVILAIPHREYKEAGWKRFEQLLDGEEGLVLDIKNSLDRREKPEKVELWRI